MLKTTIDRSILLDFYESLYSKLLSEDSSLEDKKFATSFLEFIKKGTHLHIINFSESNIFLNDLTQGRGDSNISISKKSFNNPDNFIANFQYPGRCYFVDIKDDSLRSKYKSDYGFFLSYLDEYRQRFNELSQADLIKKLIVREDVLINSLKAWTDLTKYLLPFTDVVFIDNYIFSYPELNDINLIPLLTILDNSTPVKYNLLFISYEGDHREVNLEKVKSDLLKIRKDNNLRFDLGVYIAGKQINEHDRGIFMNYMRIKSGDSFNYFNQDGSLRTHGTEVEICPYVDHVNSTNSKEILKSIKKKFRLDNPDPYRFFGRKDNRLLDY